MSHSSHEPLVDSTVSPVSTDVSRTAAIEPHPSFPILVAVAGDECTTPTVRLTEALAAQRGATPTLLYVMELAPVAAMDGSVSTEVLLQTFLDPVQRAKDEQALRATCHVDTGTPATWPFTIDLGSTAASVVTRARRIHAQLIIMGLHHHGAVDHLLAADTLRNVMAIGATPVLAIRPTLTALPERIVVAVDFSVASIRAAHIARQLLADRGTLHLVYVGPIELGTANEHEQGRHFVEAHGVGVAFQEVITMLAPDPGMTVMPVTRFGDPIDELKAVCADVRPDVVAIGSQRHPFLDRLILGTVTRAIVDDGRWSVLVTPPTSRVGA